MSSHDSMEMVLKCFQRGAADFLVKPVRKNELKNLWQHVWRRCHSVSWRPVISLRYILSCVHALLCACLIACMCAFLPLYVPVWMPLRMRVRVCAQPAVCAPHVCASPLSCMLACEPASLCACSLVHAFLPICLPECVPARLPACLPACVCVSRMPSCHVEWPLCISLDVTLHSLVSLQVVLISLQADLLTLFFPGPSPPLPPPSSPLAVEVAAAVARTGRSFTAASRWCPMPATATATAMVTAA